MGCQAGPSHSRWCNASSRIPTGILPRGCSRPVSATAPGAAPSCPSSVGPDPALKPLLLHPQPAGSLQQCLREEPALLRAGPEAGVGAAPAPQLLPAGRASESRGAPGAGGRPGPPPGATTPSRDQQLVRGGGGGLGVGCGVPTRTSKTSAGGCRRAGRGSSVPNYSPR